MVERVSLLVEVSVFKTNYIIAFLAAVSFTKLLVPLGHELQCLLKEHLRRDYDLLLV